MFLSLPEANPHKTADLKTLTEEIKKVKDKTVAAKSLRDMVQSAYSVATETVEV